VGALLPSISKVIAQIKIAITHQKIILLKLIIHFYRTFLMSPMDYLSFALEPFGTVLA